MSTKSLPKQSLMKTESSTLSLPPKKSGWPLIGSILGNIEFLGDKGQFFKGCHGDITSARIHTQRFVIISNPKLWEKIYRHHDSHVEGASSWSTFKKLFGENSLLYLCGRSHKRLRNVLLPCFRPSDLLKTATQIQEITARRVHMWAMDDAVEANLAVEEFVFELGMSFIGVEYDSLQRGESRRLSEEVHDITLAFFSLPIDLGKWSLLGRGILARKDILRVVTDTINERKRVNEGKTSNTGGAKKRMVDDDLLQRMLAVRDENGEPLSIDIIKDTMLAFVIAAFETTSASLLAFLMNMCRYPEIQEKAHCHIRDVLGEDSTEFTDSAPIGDEHWQQFDYIEQIILELRRFDPPVSMSSSRAVLKDFELGGYRIQKGSTLLNDVLTPSRSPDLWDNPDTFDPDRFDKSRPDYKQKVAQLQTFGGGFRVCIGRGFAALELKVVIVLLLRDYKIEFVDPESAPNVTYPANMILDGPLNIKLTRRENRLRR